VNSFFCLCPDVQCFFSDVTSIFCFLCLDVESNIFCFFVLLCSQFFLFFFPWSAFFLSVFVVQT
jgi:hypothetical protein